MHAHNSRARACSFEIEIDARRSKTSSVARIGRRSCAVCAVGAAAAAATRRAATMAAATTLAVLINRNVGERPLGLMKRL